MTSFQDQSRFDLGSRILHYRGHSYDHITAIRMLGQRSPSVMRGEMVGKKKAAINQPTTIDRSKKLMAELGLNGSKWGMDIVNANERGVVVLPKEIRKRLDHGCGCEFVRMAMFRGGVGSTMVPTPFCRLFLRDNYGVPSGDGSGSD